MATYRGSGSGDYLTAYQDGDVLIGNGGDDVFATNGAWFRAEGGAGNDLFYVMSRDTIVVEAALAGIDSVRLYMAGAYVLPDQIENLDFVDSGATDGTGNALDNVIRGNAGANRLEGLGGDDLIEGGGGGDRIDGGAGDDFLNPGTGDATVAAGSGRDTIYVNKDIVEGHYVVEDFSASEDQIQVRGFWDYDLAQRGADTLVTFSPYVTVLLEGVDSSALGGANFDIAPRPDAHTFVGTDNVESVYGWADGDRCYALAGDDYLGDHDGGWSYFYGGKGNDSYDVDNPLDRVIELAGEGEDLIWLYMGASYAMPNHVEAINLMGAATVTGNAAANLMQGSGGDDVLIGLGGDDVLRAQFGADRLEGGDGADLLDGGGGRSEILTGAGADSLSVEWESGNHVVGDFNLAEDRFKVWSFTRFQSLEQVGADTLVTFWSGYGGDPAATTSMLLREIDARALGSDNFTFVQAGTAAAETMLGGYYGDEINGAGGADLVTGAAGEDNLSGGSANDRLWGGVGDDALRAGSGNDMLIGGAGGDLLSGSLGADRYIFHSATDSLVADMDMIYGFDAASGDRIDLSRIDAIAGAEGDQAFTMVGAFTGQAGEAALSYDAATDRTLLTLDLNGDKVADFGLVILGHATAEIGWTL